MVETYEEATEKEQEETPEEEEYLKGHPNYADEVPDDYDGESLEEKYEDVENIIVSSPDYLTEESPEGDDWQKKRPPIPEQPDIPQPDFGVDLSGLDVSGLLEFIAKVNANILAALFDIADSVEPRSNIVISGTNSIDTANSPTPAVPKTNEVDIPTRELLIKADTDNSKPIAFGDDTISPESGFILTPGESIFLEIDLRGEELYMSSEEAGQEVNLLGLL